MCSGQFGPRVLPQPWNVMNLNYLEEVRGKKREALLYQEENSCRIFTQPNEVGLSLGVAVCLFITTQPARPTTVDRSVDRKLYLTSLSTDLSTALCTDQGPHDLYLSFCYNSPSSSSHCTGQVPVDISYISPCSFSYCTVLNCTVLYRLL